mmetsp:Transcript_23784/g.32584  ORF Transcript_23784/g.32584 Transcript_23784/m.32584 type:complete len:209 (-) Transcript_23784:1105-1731(-)
MVEIMVVLHHVGQDVDAGQVRVAAHQQQVRERGGAVDHLLVIVDVEASLAVVRGLRLSGGGRAGSRGQLLLLVAGHSPTLTPRQLGGGRAASGVDGARGVIGMAGVGGEWLRVERGGCEGGPGVLQGGGRGLLPQTAQLQLLLEACRLRFVGAGLLQVLLDGRQRVRQLRERAVAGLVAVSAGPEAALGADGHLAVLLVVVLHLVLHR